MDGDEKQGMLQQPVAFMPHSKRGTPLALPPGDWSRPVLA